MVRVDPVGVFVFQRFVTVPVAMGLRPLPALMVMLVMLFMDMQMIMLQRAVQMLQLVRVVRRP